MPAVLCGPICVRFSDSLVSPESPQLPPRLTWKSPERKHGTNYFSTECHKTVTLQDRQGHPETPRNEAEEFHTT